MQAFMKIFKKYSYHTFPSREQYYSTIIGSTTLPSFKQEDN
jgi:hypothetical protein